MSTTAEPSTITETMAADQRRFESEYIQHLSKSYSKSFIDAELSSDDDYM